ncbi:MAG: EamA family transporter, partial [Mesorhizobium sp.]
YFTALRNAPAVEASLIAYLWPLLIVLGSALMPGERLAWNHVVGALLGLAGTFLIVTKGGGIAFDARYAFYAWDIGVKRGNIQVLGAASYAAPLLSTLVLISAGFAEPSLRILAACVLITGGAALAAKSLFLRKRAASEAGA